MGGSPGIKTTVDPTGGGTPGGAPGGGGGGGGGMPLEIWIVMIDPGTVCPLGDVPTTAPYGAGLFTGVDSLATWKPASRSRWRALLSLRPETLGTFEPGAPSTYRGSVGGSAIGPKLLAIGFIAVNHVRAGSLPPNRLPSPPHCRSGNEQSAPGAVESS